MTTLIKLLKDRSGASAAEYAMILAIVGSVIVLAAVLLGGTIGNSMNSTAECIDSNGSSC